MTEETLTETNNYSELKNDTSSNDFLNQASLDYLINTKQYKINLTNAMNKKINRKDKKFYRKRILSLTKDLLTKEESEIVVSPDIKCAFDNLVKTCINYFKILDRNDIIQEDYNGFDEEIKVAEDYHFSKQIKPKKFGRINNVVFTPPRRFENKGLLYMTKLFLGSFFNHKNKSYFMEDKNYWK